MNRIILFLVLSSVFLLSCSPTRKLRNQLPVNIEQSPVFNKSFTGFALFDPEKEEMIYEFNADKYFTPASNTKIFTLYTSMNILGDLVPALTYEVFGDSLVFWGTGDPSFLHPFLDPDDYVLEFLRNRKEQLFFCPYNFQEPRFGSGWAWDDYPYYYQPEKSAFPIYGNVVLFQRDSLKKGFEVFPNYFEDEVLFNSELGGERPLIVRDEFENKFTHNAQAITGPTFERETPFKYTDLLCTNLLTDTLKKRVNLLEINLLPSQESEDLLNATTLPLYQKLMIESDNFIAEQLLLMCSHKKYGFLNIDKIIEYAKDTLMADFPDELLWVDGSGLSRYNMFTPRTIIHLLQKIHQQMPEEQIFNIFPAGGYSGTISNWYGGEGNAYVFAKTGTLRGKHCLSGYIKTQKGKTLIFSFMHNNFKTSSTPLKKEMQRVLKQIHENY